MSEPSRGDADALFSIYTFKSSIARPPYLRRNVRKAISYLTMGSTFSTIKSSIGGKSHEDTMAFEDEDDEDPRPAKRRRINLAGDNENSSRNSVASDLRQPFSQVTNGSIRSSARRVEVLPPSDFYGRLRAPHSDGLISTRSGSVTKHNRTSMSTFLPNKPYNFTESLRVDLIQIISTPGNADVDFEFSRGRIIPFEIRCRCSVAIFYGNDVPFKDYVEVSRLNKTCTLQIGYGDHGEITRKVILSEPFIFVPENFYVNRKTRRPNGQFASGKGSQHTFGLADDYNLQVFIEPAGFDNDWPPLAIQAVEEYAAGDDFKPQKFPISQALRESTLEKDELYLFCNTNAFVDCHKSSRAAPIQIRHKNTRQRVPYALKLQLDWALPTPFMGVDIKVPKSELIGAPLPEPVVLNLPASPLPRHQQDRVSEPASPADERMHRRRSNVATYNLKALSAQAQGKSPRKTKEPRSRSEQRALEDGETSVKYSFHKGHAVDVGIKRETTVSGLKCPCCICRCMSLDELRMHLQIDHSVFKFTLKKKEPRVEFFVDLARPRSGPISNYELSRTFQMGKPISLFDLEAYLRGDDSWARERQGPQNNCWPDHLIDRTNDSSMSSSPHDSRQSSPNTSTDMMEYEYHEHKPPAPKSKVFVIPKTKKPLYHTTTKQVLQPGDELSDGDSEVDEDWLNHRKRELLDEFIDVAPQEKEYLHQWNIFLIEQNLTSDKFIPQAVVRFAEANKHWLMETSNRRVEFIRHLEAFKLRGVLDTTCIQKCFWILKSVEQVQASKKGKACEADVEMGGMDEQPQPGNQRGPGECICREMPQGSQRIVCHGQRCKARHFHRACAEKLGRTLSAQWKCDNCSP